MSNGLVRISRAQLHDWRNHSQFLESRRTLPNHAMGSGSQRTVGCFFRHPEQRTCPQSFVKQEEPLQTLRASTDIQLRRGLPPMVSEFRDTTRFAAQPSPPLTRKLSNIPFRTRLASAETALGFQTTPTDAQQIFLKKLVHETLCVGHLVEAASGGP